MEIALTSARQVCIMLLLALAGMACYRCKWIDNEGSRQISSLLLQVVTPIIVIVSYQKEFEADKLVGLGLAFLLSVISFAFTILFAHIVFRKGIREQIFTVVFSNASFFSVPIVMAVLGTEAVFYLSSYLICFNVMTWTYGVFLMSAGEARMSIKKAIINPGVIGVTLGLMLFVSPVKLPSLIFQTLQSIANLNTPLAMMVFGIFLAQIPIASLLTDHRVWMVSLARLFVVPACIVMMFGFVSQQFEIVKLTVLVASSAPVAIISVLFGRQFNKDYIFATKAVGLSTVLSIVSIPTMILFAQFIW